MALSERLALLITANGSQAVGEMNRVGTAANRSLATAETASARTQANLTRLGVGFVTMGGLAAYGMYQAGQAAADLEQAVGGTEAVFGEASSIIDDFATQAAESMGLSEQAFRDGTTRIGALLTNMGYSQEEAANKSVEMAQAAADLAATVGGDTTEALHAMGRALVGEFDPLESYAVSLRQADINARALADSGKTSAETLTQQERSHAALALIMERSAFAQGQFAREADTAAGSQAILAAQWDNLVATIGEGALPVMTEAFGLLSGLVGAVGSLNDAMGGQLGAFATWAAGIALVVGGVALLTSKLWAMGAASKAAVVSAARWVLMHPPLAAVAAAALAAAAAFAVMQGDIHGAVSESENLLTRLGEFGSDDAIGRWAESMQDLPTEEVVSRLREVGEESMSAALRLGQAFVAAGGDVSVVSDALGDLAAETYNEQQAAEAAEEATLRLAAAHGDAGAQAELQADAIDQLVSEIDAYLEQIHSIPEAQDALQESFQGLFESVVENGRVFRGDSEAARENRAALRGVVESHAELISKMIENNASNAELRAATDLTIGRLRAARDAGLITGAQFDTLAGQIRGIPGSPRVNVQTNIGTVTGQVAGLLGQLDALDGKTVTANVSILGFPVTPRAHGGFIREGERSMVHGGEMVSVQGGKATVTPAVSVRAGGGGGPVTLSKRSIRDLAYAINQGAADRPIFARGYD